jgi:hypothetical protein
MTTPAKYIHRATWFDSKLNAWRTSPEYKNIYQYINSTNPDNPEVTVSKIKEILANSGGVIRNAGYYEFEIEFPGPEQMAEFLLRWS